MRNKKIIIILATLIVLIGAIFLVNNIYQNRNRINKTKRKRQNNLAIMIKEDGATDYTKSSSKDIPKGDYTLNREKSYCKNNGVIGDYDSALGKVSFSFIGTDSCYLYFDYSTYQAKKLILDNNGGSTNIKNGKSPSMAMLNDDLGQSYYFTNENVNNYIKFGKYFRTTYLYYKNDQTYITEDDCLLNEKTSTCSSKLLATSGSNMLWRIIRINGDGSIRIVYSGTDNDSDLKNIGNKQFNKSGYCDDFTNDCFSYMTSSTSGGIEYNVNDSYIKEYIGIWYSTFLKKTQNTSVDFSKYISDAIYCNDRGVPGGENGTPIIENEMTMYSYSERENNNSYQFSCKNKYNSLTVNKYISNYEGTGTLNNPVALMIADEVKLTQMSNIKLTMTPYAMYNGGQSILAFNLSTSTVSNVNPVISLSKDVTLSGNGTKESPYYIQELESYS